MVTLHRRALKITLIAELPLLLVALALFAWAIHALRTAETFVNLAVHPSASGDRSPWGLDLGTQVVTWTSTFTGALPLSSLVVSWLPQRSLYVYTQATSVFTSTSTSYAPTMTAIRTGSTSGTITATYTRSVYPGAYGTVMYADEYERAGVDDPSTLPSWQRGEYDRYLSSLYPSLSTLPIPTPMSITTSLPTISPGLPLPRGVSEPRITAAPLLRREGSWSEGWTLESMDGLYTVSWEALSDLRLWISMFAVCLVAVVMRVTGNAVYLILSPRKSTTVLLLCMATIASALLLACGVTLWYYFDRWQTLNAADVRATFAFWIIVTFTSIVVVAIAALQTKRCDAPDNQKMRRASSSSSDTEAGSTAAGHELPVERAKLNE